MTTSTVAETTPAQAQKWTNGSALTSKLITVGVVAMIFCGPVALVVAHGAGVAAARRPVAVATDGGLTPVQQSTGSFALGFLGAWLGATQDDPSALRDYLPQLPTTLSQTPFVYRNLAVTSITPTDHKLVSVVVAADVQDPQLEADTPAAWPRRYFQIAIATHGTELAAIGLPTPVAGPGTANSPPGLGYGSQLPATEKAGQTVTLFLGAYLTGQGATEPYVSPSTSIDAISPAPFAQLTPISYLVDERPAATPADGARLRVLATVALQNTVGQTLTATYALDLRARAGRWEIRAIQATPTLAESSDSTTTSHSSTTSGTSKGTGK